MPLNSDAMTEAQMGRHFRAVLKAGVRPLTAFEHIAAEVDFSQGRPDFVGVIGKNHPARTLPKLYKSSRIPLSHIARVLTVLERDQTIAVTDLSMATSLTPSRIRHILRPLEQIDAVCADSDDIVRVLNLDNIVRPNLWAFELKLDDWKRCLFQTLVCRSYARRVTAVFPLTKKPLISRVAGLFEQHRIGVMLFDPAEKKLTQLIKTTEQKPMSSYLSWMSCFEVATP